MVKYVLIKRFKNMDKNFFRLILAAFPEVIASPVPQTENYIYVIAKKEYFQTSGLQNFLKLKKLWVSICIFAQ